MRKLLKENLTQKIILVLVIAILCNFIIPNYSHADNSLGGVLLSPIKSFLAFIGDVVMSLTNMCLTGHWVGAGTAKAQGTASDWEDYWVENSDKIDWPTILVSPQEIFQGKVLALNVNFLKEITNSSYEITVGENATDDTLRSQLQSEIIGTDDYETSLSDLRAQIAKWYILIRNLAAAGLLCVLIYIGIRMVISSASEERAKYKSMMVNWVVAICLVFFLHYIMSVIMFVTEKMTDIIGSGLNTDYTIYRPETDTPELFKIKEGAKIGTGTVDGLDIEAHVYNLIELVRVYVSLEEQGLAFSYLLVYLVLVVYTLIFVFKYLKRFMYMAFLTMIAPVIAFTYPIDKMKDGSAQAFNAWLVEYLFNALLQPVHLLVYVVLVGTATDLIQTNLIYTIVALFFINKAEEILKKFFGLNKASTAGGGAGAFAKGALASQALNAIKSAGSSSKGSGSKSLGGDGGSGKSGSKPRQTKGLDSYVGANGKTKLDRNPDDKVKLNASNGQRTSDGQTNTSGQELGPWSKMNKSKEEYQEKYGSSVPWKLDSGADYNTDKMHSANKERGLSQAKNGNDESKLQKKRKIKAPNGYNKTRKGAIAGIAKSAGKAIGKGAWKATKYTGKKIGRGAIRALAAAPGAFLGGAMAIATGNTSYLAAGAGLGYTLGGKAADALGKAPKAIRSSYRKERLGTQGAAAKERYEEFKKNSDNINYFKEEHGLSTKEAKSRIEEGRNFIEAGYTNPEDIDRLIKMQDTFKDATPDQIMAADQYASKYGADYFMDDKKITTLEDSSTQAIISESAKKGYEIDEKSARKMAQKHINMMANSKGMPSIDFEAKRKSAEAKAKKEAEAAKLDAEYKKAMINQARLNTGSSRRSSSRTSSSRTRASSSRTSSSRTRASSSRTSSSRASSGTSSNRKGSTRRNKK